MAVSHEFVKREASEWYIKVWGEMRLGSFASSQVRVSSRVREFARVREACYFFPDPKYNKIAKILPRLVDADALWQLDG